MPIESYTPEHFQTLGSDDVRSFLEQHRFGTVTSHEDGRWVVSHVPLVVEFFHDQPQKIRGHVARANQHYQLFDAGGETLVSVHGPDAYISPEWYDHLNVPTWDYANVHLAGPIRRLGDEELVPHLGELLASFNGGTSQSALAEYPEEYIARYAPEVVGFEISVQSVAPVFKLSQDKSPANLESILRNLAARNGNGDAALAGLIQAQARNVGKVPQA